MATEPITIVPVPELDKEEGAAQLNLSTMKLGNGKISSCAHIEFKSPNTGRGFIGVSFLICGDFRKYLKTAPGKGTQKVLDTQHTQVFTPEAIEALKVEALAFYAAKKGHVA